MTSPEEQFVELTKCNTPVTEAQIERIFNELKPVRPSFLIGEWDGGGLDTGHPGHKTLVAMKWAGKSFRSVDDADPIVVLDETGRRVCSEKWGHSSLREVVFRGVTSAAMIYDNKPIFDHFRYVHDDMVLGVMDCPKVMGADSFYYFFLRRRKD
ncbi:hypothetical protein AJ79_03605 [Helicocarpus griseus UAMH5409]|uniref:GXWXG domain-containing protein n=1 Tax=Helicocarpus griseus UAMH5409 TaxID=1447875 RepID=A0A2B7XX10_9EURO|nr:hypothetical protein AJ79_03605 [Helicocarpus griseus UAMH5409]